VCTQEVIKGLVPRMEWNGPTKKGKPDALPIKAGRSPWFAFTVYRRDVLNYWFVLHTDDATMVNSAQICIAAHLLLGLVQGRLISL